MNESRRLYAETFIQDSESIYNSLEGHHNFSDTPSIWYNEFGLIEPIDATLNKQVAVVHEMVLDFIHEESDDPADSDTPVGTVKRESTEGYLNEVIREQIVQIESDYNVKLVMDDHLFAPDYLADAFNERRFGIETIENDLLFYAEKITFYLKLYDKYKGSFSDSDVDDILDMAEHEVFGYGYDDDEDTTIGRIRQVGNEAYDELDEIMRELEGQKIETIEAHEELDALMTDSNKLFDYLFNYIYY